jgi:hypothetical protein
MRGIRGEHRSPRPCDRAEAISPFHHFFHRFRIAQYFGSHLRWIAPKAIIKVGQEHQIAAIGQALAHLPHDRADAQTVHLENHRGPGPLSIRRAKKTEAGQFPSWVLIVTSARGIGTFLLGSLRTNADSYRISSICENARHRQNHFAGTHQTHYSRRRHTRFEDSRSVLELARVRLE